MDVCYVWSLKNLFDAQIDICLLWIITVKPFAKFDHVWLWFLCFFMSHSISEASFTNKVKLRVGHGQLNASFVLSEI